MSESTECKKLEEALHQRLKIERVLSDISTRFTAFTNFDEAISTTLAEIGALMEADRVYIYHYHDNNTKMSNTHEWCSPGTQSIKIMMQNLTRDKFPWWYKRLKTQEWFCIQDTKKLDHEARAEREYCEKYNVGAFIIFPLYFRLEISGFLGISVINQPRNWAEEDVRILRVCTAIIGSALAHREAEKELQEKELCYRALFEQSNDAIFLINLDGNTRDLNQKAGDLLGYKCEELIGKPVKQTVVDYDHESSQDKLERLIKGENIPIYQRIFRKSDGTEFPAEINVMLVRDSEENPQYMQTIVRDISGRKQIEETLREKELYYRSLFDQSNDAIFIKGLDMKNIDVNQKAAELLGYERHELLGMSISQVVVPAEYESSLQNLDLMLKGEKLPLYYRTFRKNDSTEIQVEINVSLIRNEEGEPLFIQSIVRDIRDRNRMEEALKERESRYRSLFNQNNDAVFLISWEKGFPYIDVNQKAADMLGYTQEELIGMPIHQTVVDFDHERAFQLLKSLKIGETIPIYERRFRRKDGTEFIGEVALMVVKDSKGNPLYSQSIVRDITERSQAEAALNVSEAKYRTILESIEDGYYEVDLAGNLTFFNASMCTILGYPSDELLGTNNRDYMDEKNAKKVFKLFNDVYRTRKPVRGIDWEFIRKDGTKRYLEVSVSLIYDSTNVPIGFRGIGRDITEQKRAKEKLTLLHELERINVELRENEEKFRVLAESSSVGLVIFQNYQIKYVNKALLQLIGYSKEEALGWSASDIFKPIYPEDIAFVKKQLLKRQSSDENVAISRYPLRLITKTNKIKWVEIFSAITTYQGELASIGSIVDITDQKQREEDNKLLLEKLEWSNAALSESEEKFRLLAESALVGIAIFQENAISYVNDALTRISGYPKDEIACWTTNDLFKMIHPDDLPYVKDQMLKKQAEEIGKVVSRYQCRIFTKTKELRWIEVHSRTIFYQSNSAILITVIDNTERREAESKLQESEQKFRSLAESSLIGIAILQENQLKYINNTMVKILGRPKKKVIHWTTNDILKIIHPDDLSFATKQMRMKQTGEKIGVVPRYHFRLMMPSNEIKWVEIFSKTINYQGKPAVLASIIDITGRKKVEAKVKSSEQKYRESEHRYRQLFEESQSSEQKYRESEHRYRQLFEESPISLWEEDFSAVKHYLNSLQNRGITDFREYFEIHPEEVIKCASLIKIIDINPATMQLYGANHREELLTNLNTIFGEESYSVFENELIAIAEGHTSFETEGINYTLQGKRLHIKLEAVVATGYEDTLSKVIISVIDLTEQKQVEKSLRNSEEKFRVLSESSLVGAAIIQENKMIYVNTALSQLSGYTKEEMTNWTTVDILEHTYPDDVSFAKEQLLKLQTGDIVNYAPRFQLRLLSKERAYIWADIFASIINYEDKPAAFITLVDFTNQKKREEDNLRLLQELKRVNADLSEFVKFISQDLKTSLRGIKYIVDWLITDYLDMFDTDGKKRLQLLLEKVIHINDIIQGILGDSSIKRQ